MALPKSQEKRIRAMIAQVHERRLAESLAPVEETIQRWREGEGTVFAVDEAIHLHQMRSKRYWNLYAHTAATSPQVLYILDEALELGLISPEQHRELARIRLVTR